MNSTEQNIIEYNTIQYNIYTVVMQCFDRDTP